MSQDLNDMAYFAAVVQHHGFTAAGKALGVSKSLISRRVAELEARLGVRLLQRSSRKLQITDIGQKYAEQCVKMLEQAEVAQQIINDISGQPKGRLRISAPVMMSEVLIGPLVQDFLAQYHEVQIDLLAINRDVDILDEGIDIAFQAKPLPLADSNLHMKSLGNQRDWLVASPDFVAQYGNQLTLEGLSRLPTLSRSRMSYWILENEQQQRVRIDIQPRLSANNLNVLVQAAAKGLGVTLIPEYDCYKAIDDGRLIQVLPQWRSPSTHVHAIFASNKGLSLVCRTFLDYMAEQLRPRFN